MKNSLYRAGIVLLYLFLGFTYVTSQIGIPPGTKLSGSFGVSDAGTATYSIPINLPPGAGAMKPNLSLNYNSNGGNGLLGMGWAISGMSYITRGNKTFAQDSISEKVQFNWNDVYYLDGERLVLLSDEIEYGKDGANYGTETNSFVKVTSLGEEGFGPNSFEVKTKTGITMTFGIKQVNKVYVNVNSSNEVMFWLLDKMEDTNGNFIEYFYEMDPEHGSYRPLRINYTRNNNSGISTNFTDVLFEYEDRNETDYIYIYGIKSSITKRLKNILIKHKDAIKETYSFTYQNFGTNNLSLLEKIEHCMDDGFCADPITFLWQMGAEELSFKLINNILPLEDFKGDKKELYNHDISNDGLTDIILVDREANSVKFYINNNNLSFIIVNSNLNYISESTQLNFVDINSDGFLDIIALNITDGSNTWYINNKMISIGNGIYFETTHNYIASNFIKDNRFFLLDYTGDARLDILIINNFGFHYIYENISGDDKSKVFEFKIKSLELGITPEQFKDNIVIPADMDNDGKDDILLYSKDEWDGSNKWFKNVFASNTSQVWELEIDYFGGATNGWFNSKPISVGVSGNIPNHPYGYPYVIDNQPSQPDDIKRPKFYGLRHPKFQDINGDGLLDMLVTKMHTFVLKQNNDNLFYTQQEKLFVFINKGNFQFEPEQIRSSNGWNDVTEHVSCLPENCSSPLCYLGYFTTHLIYNSGQSFFSENSSERYYRQNIPYYLDINADGKADLITTFDDSKIVVNSRFSNDDLLCNNMVVQAASIPNLNGGFEMSFGNFDRFGTDILLFNKYTGETRLYKNESDPKPPVINAILGPVGGYIYITYGSLNDEDVYKGGNSRTYPEINYSSSSQVVKEYRVQAYDGQISSNSHVDVTHLKYTYFDGRVNLQGRGFRGFAKIVITDEIERFKVVKEFEQNSRLIGASLKKTSTYTINDTLLSEEIYRNAQLEYHSDGSGGIYVPWNISTVQDKMFTPFPIESISRTYELDGSLLVENKSRSSIDRFGNILYQIFDYGDGCMDSIVNEYYNDFDSWFIGRLTSSKVYKNCTGKDQIIRESAFEYNPITGLLTKEILEPYEDDTIKVIKEYEHDFWGNITQSSESAWNGNQLEVRSKYTKYDPTGRFQIESKNQLDHTISIKYDDYRGMPIEFIDENKLITKLQYDSYGKNTRTEYPDGNWSEVFTHLGFEFSEAIQSNVTGSNLAWSFLVMDQAGRETKSSESSFNGDEIVSGIHYFKNKVHEREEPHSVSNVSPEIISYEYDIAGRLSKQIITGNNGNEIEYGRIYNGLSEIVVNPLDQFQTNRKDVQQRLSEATDNAGNRIKYNYDIQGQLIKIEAGEAGNYTISYEYDLRGRMTSMTDPILGKEEYAYDGFGNMISKIDGNGNVTSFAYDVLNRLKSMTQSEGTATYVYDQGNKAIGKLSKVIYPNFEKSFLYDNLGRIKIVITKIDGQSYIYKYEYNAIGKLSRIEHPSGISLIYYYNDQFYLYKIENSASNTPIWEAVNVDEKNRITEEKYGNGVTTYYQYDSQENLYSILAVKDETVIQELYYEYNELNLKTRKNDFINFVFEEYVYDDLNRLIQVSSSGHVDDILSMTYDSWGNIQTKSDLGVYHYSNTNPTKLERIEFYSPDCTLPSSKYTYEYSSFNKVISIAGDSNRLELVYGPNNQRIKQNVYQHGALRESRIYVDSDFEIQYLNGVETKRMTLTSPYGPIGVYEIVGNNSGEISYFQKDNQGTVVGLCDDEGNRTYSFIYDVWGKRKVIFSQDSLLGLSYRGFTGHEHISIFDLINMNGRVYDPILARFLSPDPFIQNYSNFQSFNRYSYVYNSPNNLIDPSGYLSIGGTPGKWLRSAEKTINRFSNGVVSISNGNIRDGLSSIGQGYLDIYLKWTGWREVDRRGKDALGEETWNQIVVAAATITVAYFTAGTGTGLGVAIMSGMASGATGGVLSTAIAGGGANDILKAGFKGAVIGGISAGITYGVGSGAEALSESGVNTFAVEGLRAVGHAVVQGGVNELQGGKFSHGFYSGLASSIGSHTKGLYPSSLGGKVFMSSLVGGTVSSVSGGKFATGAVSGAFVEMYNCQAHEACLKQGKIRDIEDSHFTEYELENYREIKASQIFMGTQADIGYSIYIGAEAATMSSSEWIIWSLTPSQIGQEGPLTGPGFNPNIKEYPYYK